MAIWLDWLAQNWPILFGVVVALGFVWRVSQRVLDHIESTQTGNHRQAEQFAERLDRAEERCVEHMTAIADGLKPILDRSSDLMSRNIVALDRHERGERWAMMSQGEVVDVDNFSKLDNPNNEPVYGIPPGERTPEILLRDASILEEKRDWGHRVLGIDELHEAGITGVGVVVAILDTGVDAQHPGLAGQVISSPNHTNSPTSSDRQGHGTHCAGIVAEKADGGGLVGVAPSAKIHAGKVLGDNGSGLSSGIANGIRAATASGVDVISMSLGGPAPDSATRAAITEAVKSGVWVVCAAGNEGPGESPSYPGNYPDVVCVAAVDEAGNVARFSSRNREVDIAAPGVSILSTYPGGRYASLSGTSMATPYVAGVFALLRGEVKKRGLRIPSLSKVLEIMAKTAKDITPSGRDTASGAGLIQPKQLIEAVLADLAGGTNPPSPPPPPPGGKLVRLTHPDLVAAGVPAVVVEIGTATSKPTMPDLNFGEGLLPIPAGLKIALGLLVPILRRIAERTNTPIDDMVLRIIETVFGLSRRRSVAAASETDWFKTALDVVRALLPTLKELASRTGTNIDDLILEVVEKLLTSTKSGRGLSSSEITAKARILASEAELLTAA
jgi:subtilisin